jgi:hypothetical protein
VVAKAICLRRLYPPISEGILLFAAERGTQARTHERTADCLLIFLTGVACAIWLPSSARAQVPEAPAAVLPVRPAIALRPDEPIKVRHGFEQLTGRFAGWHGDSLALLFAIGDPLVLPIVEIREIAARRHSPDRAIAAGLLFGVIAWLTFKVELALGGGLTQCKECVNRADVWKKTGRVALVTTSLFLVSDYFHPPYRVVYRRVD